jgi:hypothetical protein
MRRTCPVDWPTDRPTDRPIDPSGLWWSIQKLLLEIGLHWERSSSSFFFCFCCATNQLGFSISAMFTNRNQETRVWASVASAIEWLLSRTLFRSTVTPTDFQVFIEISFLQVFRWRRHSVYTQYTYIQRSIQQSSSHHFTWRRWRWCCCHYCYHFKNAE